MFPGQTLAEKSEFQKFYNGNIEKKYQLRLSVLLLTAVLIAMLGNVSTHVGGVILCGGGKTTSWSNLPSLAAMG